MKNFEFDRIKEADSLIKQKLFTNARSILNDIYRLNPVSTIALANLVVIEILEGHFNKALDLTYRILQLVVSGTGKIEKEQPIYIFLELLNSGVDHWLVRLNLALAYWQYNNAVQARDFFKTVSSPCEEIQKLIYLLLKNHYYYLFVYKPLPLEMLRFENKNRYKKGDLVIATSSCSLFFPQVVNLIGSLHYHCLPRLRKIIVYDIGLEDWQKNYVEQLSKVKVKTVPRFYPHAFAW